MKEFHYYALDLTKAKEELKRVLTTLIDLPNDDSVDNVRKLINSLNQLLRIRLITPPTSEVMIVLAHQKPLLYHAARMSIHRNSHLKILFDIKGQNDIAEKRLNEFISQL